MALQRLDHWLLSKNVNNSDKVKIKFSKMSDSKFFGFVTIDLVGFEDTGSFASFTAINSLNEIKKLANYISEHEIK